MRSDILLYGTEPCDAGASSWSSPVLWEGDLTVGGGWL